MSPEHSSAAQPRNNTQFLTFWRLEAQDGGAGRAGFLQGLSCCLFLLFSVPAHPPRLFVGVNFLF